MNLGKMRLGTKTMNLKSTNLGSKSSKFATSPKLYWATRLLAK